MGGMSKNLQPCFKTATLLFKFHFSAELNTIQLSSVAQLCPTLSDTDCSTAGYTSNSITNSRSLLKLLSIGLVMSSKIKTTDITYWPSPINDSSTFTNSSRFFFSFVDSIECFSKQAHQQIKQVLLLPFQSSYCLLVSFLIFRVLSLC